MKGRLRGAQIRILDVGREQLIDRKGDAAEARRPPIARDRIVEIFRGGQRRFGAMDGRGDGGRRLAREACCRRERLRPQGGRVCLELGATLERCAADLARGRREGYFEGVKSTSPARGSDAI